MADQTDDDKPLELPIQRTPTSRNRNRNKKETQTPAIEPRDPRFDPRCSGSNEIRHFVRNYSFLDDVKLKELSELQRELTKEKDPERKEKIKMTISRHRNKIADHKDKLNQPTKKRQNVGDKKAKIVERYKDLKQSGKLSRYLERKRKKILKKDQKSFSY